MDDIGIGQHSTLLFSPHPIPRQLLSSCSSPETPVTQFYIAAFANLSNTISWILSLDTFTCKKTLAERIVMRDRCWLLTGHTLRRQPSHDGKVQCYISAENARKTDLGDRSVERLISYHQKDLGPLECQN